MRRPLVCFAAAALSAAPVCAQNIMEHAAAVAGATIGTGAGKALSNSIDKALGRAAKTGSDAAQKPPRVPETSPVLPQNPVSPSNPNPAAPPFSPTNLGSSGSRSRSRRASSTAARNVSSPDMVSFSGTPLSTPIPLSSADFDKIKEGAPRADVYTTLGIPSSRVTIPDEGHLIEILTYSNGYQHIGSVRIDNGQVVTVSR